MNVMTFTGKELRRMVKRNKAVRGCAVPPEDDIRAPWHFDAVVADISDNDRVPVQKIILYFEDEN